MRKVLAIVLMMIFTSTVYAQSGFDGYEGIKWGTKYEAVKNKYNWECSKDLDDVDSTVCSLKSKTTEFGKGSKRYIFYKGLFSAVSIELEEKNWDETYKLLVKTYGKPDEKIPNMYMNAYSKTIVFAIHENGLTAVMIIDKNTVEYD